MTLATIIETLKMIALKHPNVNSAYEGNIYEILNAKPDNKYASVVITQQSHTTDEVYDHYGFVIFYVDRLVDDMEENRVQIQSCGKSMLGNIITFFCEEFEAECDNITYQPFTQKFVDMTCGVYCTITIDMPKDVICPEEYWKEDWVTPVTVIRNQDKRVVFTKNGTYTIDYDPTIYTGLGTVEVDVNIDVDSYYNNGYNQGKTDGISEQKSKLETINITENGTYSKEDGYNQIVVDVPDLNGDYNEGYTQGHTDGYNEGYNKGEGIGYSQGQADVAANARVLNVTENGSYVSKYTKEDEIVMPFDLWGDDFYSYAYVKNKIYNTGIIPNENTRLEFWFKPDEADYLGGSSVVIMNNADSVYGNIFGIFHSTAGDQSYYANVGGDRVNFNLTNGVLYHIVLSVADGLVINGKQIGTFSSSSNFSEPLYINGMSNDLNASADGEFGMIKINDTIIIPTENGFLNQNTNELLEVVYDGGVYKFTEINKPLIEGNLYRTINVDVKPKINVKEAGLKFSRSTFKEVPEWAYFEGITDMNHMFDVCSNLQTIPFIDTSNVTDASNMLSYCSNLKILPNNLNLGNCTNMASMFEGVAITDYTFLTSWIINPNADMGSMITNGDTTYVPAIPCVGNNGYFQSAIFWAYGDYSKLTYFGGWIGRKYNVDKDYMLKKLPNLTYESCISILNNLYDFTGNGETPDNNQGKLKVHPNFLTTVGDEISIGTSRGWTITA